MKAKIGKYPDRLMCNLFNNYMNKKYDLVGWPAKYTRFEKSLEWIDDRVQDFYNVFNWLWFDRRQQKIKVHIDPWDTWSMDHSLAPIILPMLIQLKESKHGAPHVDDEDVPKELQSKYAVEPGNPLIGTTDSSWFDRWDWVLDEMIYAFACKAEKDEVYMRFDADDKEGMQAEQSRISNGFRLFGKYYEALWD